MIIKVCGMADPENISGLAELGLVDWMGMIFYPPSRRYVPAFSVDPQYYQRLSLPKVGVFVNATPDEIQRVGKAYGLDKVQLHGDESPGQVREIKIQTGLPLIKVLRIGKDWSWQGLEAYEELVDYFLLDTDGPSYGGTGHRFNWEIIKQYPFHKPFLLSGGIQADQAGQLVDLYQSSPHMGGIDINSKFEVRPGLKDLDLIRDFASQIRQELQKTKE
ncbi:phosphoribosylanthranilate isomerase [Cyclobacterium jeungdonense]|uniref:N-(5'-phosphoribosyl)anthranilate isomerase n=1 Tax=Cyclobacterium jeungdonense TaxID=708087 RepID=A0ABT8C8R9_9BACT|nr:phosphoribosylanthranilate isomerase [Cyclobacterium jeungdonense]MDN3688424.1 phosphoribosylanthranilate isomerase [Cyclobacterium jeungdonense]